MPYPSADSFHNFRQFSFTLLFAASLCTVAVPATAAKAVADSAFAPSGMFVQAGTSESTNAVVVGALWAWGWQRRTGWGEWSGHWDLSLGRWHIRRPDPGAAHDWVGQVGITPVLRLTPQAWGGQWFVEGGIGANLLFPTFRTEEKRFATAFNFGDHLAVGRRFGEGGQHELALRIQHFSNGGIERPNPGEDFVQLRYARHF